MAHAGFAVFFLLSLLATVAALVRVAAGQSHRIKQALRGIASVEEDPSEVRIRVRPTAEVPRIAERLNVRFPDGLAPVLRVRRAWPFEARVPV
jgi:hypothetical protein